MVTTSRSQGTLELTRWRNPRRRPHARRLRIRSEAGLGGPRGGRGGPLTCFHQCRQRWRVGFTAEDDGGELDLNGVSVEAPVVWLWDGRAGRGSSSGGAGHGGPRVRTQRRCSSKGSSVDSARGASKV